MVAAAWIGDAFWPQLADRHPLALIALNARNRNLILTTNALDAWSYYVVGAARLLVSDPLFYLLGFWYGDAAVTWMEKRTKTFGGLLRQWERWFVKAAYPLVAIAPNNIICLFAGSAGMRPRAFITLNVAGTFARLYLIRWLGDAFSRPIDWVLDFVADYRLPLTGVAIAVVVISILGDRRSGKGDLEAIAKLDTDLADTDPADTDLVDEADPEGNQLDRD